MNNLPQIILLLPATISFCFLLATLVSSFASILFAFSSNTKELFTYWKTKTKTFWKNTYSFAFGAFMVWVVLALFQIGPF